MSGFPANFPGQQQYADGFGDGAQLAELPFQSTTRRALAAAGSHVYGALCPGALVSQHRYPNPGAECEPVPYETRLGLVVGVVGWDMAGQVDVVWSAWISTPEPVGLAASRRARRAARARSASELPPVV